MDIINQYGAGKCGLCQLLGDSGQNDGHGTVKKCIWRNTEEGEKLYNDLYVPPKTLKHDKLKQVKG